MIIGVDARSLTESHPSGVSIYCFSLIKACALLSPSDTFVLFTSGYHQKPSVFLEQLLTLPNVQVTHLGWPNKVFHGLAVIGIAPKIDTILRGCDVLLAPNLHFIPLSKSVPLVVTVHDLTFELYNQFLSFRRKIWHKAVRPQRLLQRAHAIIAVSETTRQDILHHYAGSSKTGSSNVSSNILPDKIKTIHSAAPVASEPEILETLPKRYCLALSTIEPRKNIAALVEAFTEFVRRFPNSTIELVVIGSGGWKSANTIKTMQNHPRIHYFGYVSEEQKMYAMQHASGFIYPSIYEGFGFPPLEAIQAGVPVVVSQAGALPEILDNGAYYIDPYSIEDMITVFKNFDSNTAWCLQLIDQGKPIRNLYSWEKTAEATLKVLRQSI